MTYSQLHYKCTATLVSCIKVLLDSGHVVITVIMRWQPVMFYELRLRIMHLFGNTLNAKMNLQQSLDTSCNYEFYKDVFFLSESETHNYRDSDMACREHTVCLNDLFVLVYNILIGMIVIFFLCYSLELYLYYKECIKCI